MPVLPSPLRTPMGLVNLLQQLVILLGSTVVLVSKMFYTAETSYLHFAKKGLQKTNV